MPPLPLTAEELQRQLRVGRLRVFWLSHQDYSYLKALMGADPDAYQTTTYNGRTAAIREEPNGTYTLFVEGSH